MTCTKMMHGKEPVSLLGLVAPRISTQQEKYPANGFVSFS